LVSWWMFAEDGLCGRQKLAVEDQYLALWLLALP